MMYGSWGDCSGLEATLNEAGDSVQGPGVGDDPIWKYLTHRGIRGGYEMATESTTRHAGEKTLRSYNPINSSVIS